MITGKEIKYDIIDLLERFDAESPSLTKLYYLGHWITKAVGKRVSFTVENGTDVYLNYLDRKFQVWPYHIKRWAMAGKFDCYAGERLVYRIIQSGTGECKE